MTLNTQSLNLNARQILFKRLSTAQAIVYTGPLGEIIIDANLKLLRVQDGVTAGGHLMITSNVTANLQAQIDSIKSNLDPAAIDSLTEIMANVNALLANNAESQLVNSGFYANLTTTGNLVLDGSLLPKTHVAQDLGSATRSWRNLYISNATAYFGNAALTVTNNGLQVFNSNNQLIPLIGNVKFPDGTIQSTAVDQNIVANIFYLLTPNVSANLNTIHTDVTNAISYFGNLVNVAITSTQHRLKSGNAEVVLYSNGPEPYVLFPAASNGGQVGITEAEISSLAGNLALTSAEDAIIISNGSGAVPGGSRLWKADRTGNLVLPQTDMMASPAPVSLPGIIFTDGTFQNTAYTGGGSGAANTGNITFNDITIQGVGNEYGGGGIYLSPDATLTANLMYFRVRGGDNPTHLHFDVGDNTVYDQYFGDDGKYLKLEAGYQGNVLIGTNGGGSWKFGTDSSLTLPNNTKIAVSAPTGYRQTFTQDLYGNTNTGAVAGLTVIDLGSNAQLLALIDPTSGFGNSQYNLYNPITITYSDLTTQTFTTARCTSLVGGVIQLGYDASTAGHSFPITLQTSDYSLGGTSIDVDNNAWKFSTDGNLTLPQTAMDVSPAPTSWPGITFSDGTFQNTAWSGWGKLQIDNTNNQLSFGPGESYSFLNMRNDGTETRLANDGGNVQISAMSQAIGTAYYWNFVTDGNLTLPQTVMNASPAPISWPGITFSDGTFQNSGLPVSTGDGDLYTTYLTAESGWESAKATDNPGQAVLRPWANLASYSAETVVQTFWSNQVAGTPVPGQGTPISMSYYTALRVSANVGAATYNSFVRSRSGNVRITANTKSWTFGHDGRLGVQGNVLIPNPTNLQFLDISAGPLSVGSLSSVGNIAFSNGTFQTTAWTRSAAAVQSTPPASPVTGQLYYDTDDGKTYIWTGSAWVDASPGGSAAPTWQQVTLTGASVTSALYLTNSSPEYTYVVTNNESRNIRLPSSVGLVLGRRFVVRNSGNAGLPIQTSTGTAFNISIYQDQTVIATAANVSLDGTTSWMLEITGSALTGAGAHVMAFSPTITSPTFSSTTKIAGVHEKFNNLVNATGVVNHDCSTAQIFRHTTPAANWTANFTNLNLAGTYATAITILIVQGATAYYPNAVQIQGAAQTINWLGNTTPTPNANRIDSVTFSILNNSGTYTVLGQLTGF